MTKIIEYTYSSIHVVDDESRNLQFREVEINYPDSSRVITYKEPCEMRKIVQIGRDSDEPLVVCSHQNNLFYGMVKGDTLMAMAEDEWATMAVFDLGLSREEPYVSLASHASSVLSVVNEHVTV